MLVDFMNGLTLNTHNCPTSLTMNSNTSPQKMQKNFLSRRANASAFAIASFALVSISPLAHAADGTWSGATDNAWQTAGNWSGGVPGTGDTATFNANPTNRAPVIDASRNLLNLTFSSGAGLYTVGTTVGNSLTLGDGGTILQSSGNNQVINAPLVLGGTSYNITNNATAKSLVLGGTITGGVTGAAILTLGGTESGGASAVNGIISNGAATSLSIVKTGTGIWLFAGGSTANTYTGSFTISQGQVNYSNQNAFSSASSLVLGDASTGSNNVALMSRTASTLTKAVTVSSQGSGTATLGSAIGANSTMSGIITINRDIILAQTTNNGVVSFTGKITGTGNLTIDSPVTTTAAGSFVGLTLTNGTNDFVGNVTLNSMGASGPGTQYGLRLNATTNVGVIPDASNITMNTGSVLTLDNNSTSNGGETINTLIGTGGTITSSQTAGIKTLTVGSNGGTGSFGGTIQNGSTGATLAFTKSGSGTQTLGGTNTYTGATTVSAGTLLVSGSTASGSAVSVTGGSAAAAVLGGTGTIGGSISFTTAAGGILSAGGTSAIGTLTTGAVSASLASNIKMELGATAISYDILKTSGFTATNFTLDVTNLGGLTFANGQTFHLFQTQAGAPLALSGIFAARNLPTLSGGLTWDESALYSSGDLSVVPEPATWALLAFSLTTVMVMRRRSRK